MKTLVRKVQRMKRTISLFVVAVMLICLMSGLSWDVLTVKAEVRTGICGEGLSWELNQDSGELVISGSGSEMDDNQAYNGNWGWYNYGASVKTVTFDCPNLKHIGNEAFRHCMYLESIQIPDGVTSIGSDAFYDCWAMESVNIPETVQEIGPAAFYNCQKLNGVTLPSGLKIIGFSTFEACYALTEIQIPESVEDLGYEVFRECTSLKTVTVPKNVKAMEKDAFMDCIALEEVIFEDTEGEITLEDNGITDAKGFTVVEESSFKGCTSLAHVKLPNTLTTIKKEAFKDCENLESLNIPDGVTTIEENAFAGCLKLTKDNCTYPKGLNIAGTGLPNIWDLDEPSSEEQSSEEQSSNEPSSEEQSSIEPSSEEQSSNEPSSNDQTSATNGTTTQQDSVTVAPTTVTAQPTTKAKVEQVKKITKSPAKKKSSKKVIVNISKVKVATGYQLKFYKTKKDAKADKNVLVKKNVAKNTAELVVEHKKLKNQKKLFVKVRAFIKQGKKVTYGAYSAIKEIKIKK